MAGAFPSPLAVPKKIMQTRPNIDGRGENVSILLQSTTKSSIHPPFLYYLVRIINIERTIVQFVIHSIYFVLTSFIKATCILLIVAFHSLIVNPMHKQ